MVSRFAPPNGDGPIPCEGCRFVSRCRLERQSCAAFNMYAQGESATRWKLAPRAPSRALFLVLEEVAARPKARPAA